MRDTLARKTLYNYEYSKSSNSGPSKKGTVCDRPLYKGHFLRSQIPTLPIVLIPLQPPRRGQPLYKGQNKWIYIVSNVSLVQKFHCNNNLVCSKLYVHKIPCWE